MDEIASKHRFALNGVRLELDRFVPFRLSVLSNRVSGAIARQYSKRFRLSMSEWRVMAVLGLSPGLSARELSERTGMDKVQVSRAVAVLARRKHVARRADSADGRVVRLALTPKGEAVYGEIVPMARRLEAEFLSTLDENERAALDRLLTRLSRQAELLGS